MKIKDVKDIPTPDVDLADKVHKMRGAVVHTKYINAKIEQAQQRNDKAEVKRLQAHLKDITPLTRVRTGTTKGFDNPYLKDYFRKEDKFIGDPEKYTKWASKQARTQYDQLKQALVRNGLHFDVMYVGDPQNFVVVGAKGRFAWRRYLSSDGHYSNNDVAIDGKTSQTRVFVGLANDQQDELLAPLKESV